MLPTDSVQVTGVVVPLGVEDEMSDIGAARAGDGTANEIVVSVGTGPAAATALREAVRQSQETGVALRIVHTWQMTTSPLGDASTSFWVASAADARARATRWVLDTLGSSAARVRWTLDIVEGADGPVLPEPAADAVLELSNHPGGNA